MISGVRIWNSYYDRFGREARGCRVPANGAVLSSARPPTARRHLQEGDMTAFNIVRFRVKPGHEQQFIDAHRMRANPGLKGFRGGALIRTGDSTFCVVGEWSNFQNLAEARPQMIGILDTTREHLVDLGNGLGLTDPVSGEVVVRLAGEKPPAKKAARKTVA